MQIQFLQQKEVLFPTENNKTHSLEEHTDCSGERRAGTGPGQSVGDTEDDCPAAEVRGAGRSHSKRRGRGVGEEGAARHLSMLQVKPMLSGWSGKPTQTRVIWPVCTSRKRKVLLWHRETCAVEAAKHREIRARQAGGTGQKSAQSCLGNYRDTNVL